MEAEAIEEAAVAAGDGDAEVRPLPGRRAGSEIDAWRREVRTVALAAAGGLAAGAATVAAVAAVKGGAGKHPRILRRGKRDGVVASRSFLIDVHVLGR